MTTERISVPSYTKAQRPDSFIRVRVASTSAIGPGKADLLEAIGETGSLAAATRRMQISYRRSWDLVQSLNQSFRAPLVDLVKGGRAGGGAHLTGMGREVLALYRRMESKATAAIGEDLAAFRKLLRDE
jgi:molybdate transport system regulatory protein